MTVLISFLKRIEGIVAVCAYIMTAGLLLGEVIAREFFLESIWGSQKIAVFGAIVAGSIGMAIATSENSHLRPTFADGILPQPWVDRAGDLISAGLFIFFGYFGIQMVVETYEFKIVAEVIRVPLWMIQIVFPYAFFSAALRHIIFAISPDLKPQPAAAT